MRKILFLLLTFLFLGAAVYGARVRVRDLAREVFREKAPPALSVEKAKELQSKKRKGESEKAATANQNNQNLVKNSLEQTSKLEDSKEESIMLPAEINLGVPFTPQAPHANWAQPYQDGCEEASALMVHYFYQSKKFTPDVADKEILDLAAFEDSVFGYNKDTDAAQTAEFIKKYWGYKQVDVIYDIAADDIRRELARGFPVIVPVYGRALGNPYFTPPGPDYHMLVIKGFKGGKFITNDPGTRRGADFIYSEKILMDAIHDWNGGDILNGRRAMIVIRPQ